MAAKSYRRGFVLVMWTGCFPINRSGQPTIFRSRASALRTLVRYPSWGRQAVEIRHVHTRPGSNGLPDYFIGAVA